uniref:Putative transcriptional activator adenine-specific dna methyltransferase n=1 Tax=Triatoma dimidiata TaxID=72491 RepID=A0A0V0GC32_TRIDM
MSVLCSNDKGWVISHYDYTKKMYTNVLSHSGLIDLAYNKNLFNIITPMMRDEEAQHFIKAVTVKSKKEFVFARDVQTNKFGSVIDDELLSIQLAYTTLLKEARELDLFTTSPREEDYLDNNKLARSLVDTFFDTLSEEFTLYQGGNNNNYSIIANVFDKSYVIPPSCNFFSCSVEDIESKLQGNKYDFILLDPPWWNKFVRRKKSKNFRKSYNMLHNNDIQEIPISKYLNGFGLLGVWCTNSPTHLEAVKQFFRKWNLEYTAEWYWLKVTQSGDPVCQFSGKRDKKPIERIIFGSEKCRNLKNPEPGKVIMSVPSAIHSHKPPLTEVLSAYLPKDPKCLELFARYLLPGWTSVGNQVLLLQSLSLYEVVSHSDNSIT